MSDRPLTQGGVRGFVAGAVDGRLLGVAAAILTLLGGYLLVDVRATQAETRNLTLRVQSLEQSRTHSEPLADKVDALAGEVRQLREALIAKKVIRP